MSHERRTVFITGASSGIGLETAAYFFERGWNVVATMRDPDRRCTPFYNSSKWAVEGWTEALQYELDPLRIRVKLIEPGVIKTDFYGRSMESVDCTAFEREYGAILRRGRKSRDGGDDRPGTDARVVAKVVYRAATDGGSRLRYTVGNDARLVLVLRHLLPGRLFHRLLGRVLLD